MTATQAPTPGPLTAAIDMLSDARDFIDRFSDVIDGDYGTSEPNAAMVMVHEINATIEQLSAPTAPVEASGSLDETVTEVAVSTIRWAMGRGDDLRDYKEPLEHVLIAALRPQPSGETRQAVRLALEDADALDRVSEEADDNQWQDWAATMRQAASRIRRLALIRPLALGGQHSTTTDFPPDDVLACDTTPARAEAQYDAPYTGIKEEERRSWPPEPWGGIPNAEWVESYERWHNRYGPAALARRAAKKARAEAQDEGAAGEPFAYGWFDAGGAKNALSHMPKVDQVEDGSTDVFPLYSHPSPTPAADEDRVRITDADAKWLTHWLGYQKEDGHCGEGNVERRERALWNDRIDRIIVALKSEGK